MAKKNAPIRYDKFDVSNVVVTEPEDNEMVKAQRLSYPRYKIDGQLSQLVIKTPVINIFSGGIPSLGEYFKDDKSRAKNFKIPFDPNDRESAKFLEVIKSIDDMLDSDDFRSSVMGGAKNLEYQPIVRVPMVDEDDDSKPARPMCMKVNISLDYNTDNVLTKVFVKNSDGSRSPVEVKTLDDMTKYVRYKSNVCLIMMANKFYVMKNADPKTKKKTYGMTFKLLQVLVDSPSSGASNFDNEVDNFDDSDDDDVKEYIKEEIKPTDLDAGIEEEDHAPPPKSKKKSKHAEA